MEGERLEPFGVLGTECNRGNATQDEPELNLLGIEDRNGDKMYDLSWIFLFSAGVSADVNIHEFGMWEGGGRDVGSASLWRWILSMPQ